MQSPRALRAHSLFTLKAVGVSLLLACTLSYMALTVRWPLPADAAVFHYVVFLMHRGAIPYVTIRDIDWPGSYIPSLLLGASPSSAALKWRLYDFSLLVLVFVAALACLRRRRFPAIWAAGLFALAHARDGIEQAGQRDLVAAVLALLGTACLIYAPPRRTFSLAAIFGSCIGIAALMKPTLSPLLLIAFLLPFQPAAFGGAKPKPLALQVVGGAFAGFSVPLALAAVWLAHLGALHEFLTGIPRLAAFHATLARKPALHLLNLALSPAAFLFCCWIGCYVLDSQSRRSKPLLRKPLDPEHLLLAAAAFIGLLSFVVQGKGLPYQRYPFLLFAIVAGVSRLASAMESARNTRWLGVAAFAWSCLLFAPSSVIKAVHYRSITAGFVDALSTDLLNISQGEPQRLQRKVQCIDTVSGCSGALYALQIVQSTGTIFDEYLFQPSRSPVEERERGAFLASMESHPPELIIVSAPLFPSGPDDFHKLPSWPVFNDWLSSNYVLAKEWHPTAPVQSIGRMVMPPGYRIYLHHP